MYLVFVDLHHPSYPQEPKRFHGEVVKQQEQEDGSGHFLWKIPGFDGIVRARGFAFSPYFEHAGRMWGLQVSFHGRCHAHLVLTNYGDCVDSDCVTLGVKVDEKFIRRTAEPDSSGRIFTAFKFMSQAELCRLPNPQLLPDGTLTVFCKIASREQDIEEENRQHKCESIENLQQNIEDLFYNADFSDVCFLVKNTNMKAHRNILSARSPVLAEMVARDSNPDDPIYIPDVEPATFSDFLYYLYTGSFKKINSNVAMRLEPLAERYQVTELKLECELYTRRRKSVAEEEVLVDDLRQKEEAGPSGTSTRKKVTSRKRKRKS